MSNVDIEELLKQRKREKSKTPSETLVAKIDEFIAGAMPASQMDVFSKQFGPQIDAEITRRAKDKSRRADSARAEVEEYATKIWRGQQSAHNFYSEQRQFMHDYPQFVACLENIDAIATELRSQNLVPHYQNLVQVFGELIHRGELLVSPAAIEAGPEDQITGEALCHHPNLKLLLQPAEERERDRVQRQSAEEYKESRPELQDKRLPYFVIARVEKALSTFRASHPDFVVCEANKNAVTAWLEENNRPIDFANLDEAFNSLYREKKLELNDAVTQHGATKVTTFATEQRTPAIPTQHVEIVERKKQFTPAQIAAMPADEYQRWMKNPEFIEAVNKWASPSAK